MFYIPLVMIVGDDKSDYFVSVVIMVPGSTFFLNENGGRVSATSINFPGDLSNFILPIARDDFPRFYI